MLDVWSWWLLALGFVVLEVASGASLIAIFFAVGAAATALALSFGMPAQGLWPALPFVSGSVLPLLWVRRPLSAWAQRRAARHPIDALVGCTVVVHASVAPGEAGTGTLRGARWQLRNVGTGPLSAGAAYVVGIAGLTLLVDAHPPAPLVVSQ